MKILLEQVYHQQFGHGTVVEQGETAVTVRFAGAAGDERFLYPQAFIHYLTLCDGERQAQLQAEMASAEEQRVAQERQRQEELRRQRWEAEQKVIQKHKQEQRRAAAQKRQAVRSRGPA